MGRWQPLRGDDAWTGRGNAATTTRGSRPRRDDDAEVVRGPVAITPRRRRVGRSWPRRGDDVNRPGASRGDAATTTPRRRDDDAVTPRRRQGDDAATTRRRRKKSAVQRRRGDESPPTRIARAIVRGRVAPRRRTPSSPSAPSRATRRSRARLSSTRGSDTSARRRPAASSSCFCRTNG